MKARGRVLSFYGFVIIVFPNDIQFPVNLPCEKVECHNLIEIILPG